MRHNIEIESMDQEDTQKESGENLKSCFISRLENALRTVFDYEEEWSGLFGGAPKENEYYFKALRSFMIVKVEFIGEQFAVVDLQILYGKLHQNRNLALKWLEENLSGTVLNVYRPAKNDRSNKNLFFASQCFCRLDGKDTLTEYLGYVAYLLRRLHQSFDCWFDTMMPGFMVGHNYLDFSREEAEYMNAEYFSNENDPVALSTELEESGIMDLPLYWNHLMRKNWREASSLSEKIIEREIYVQSNLIDENILTLWYARNLYRSGLKNEAWEKLRQIEDFDDPYSRRLIQELTLWMLFHDGKYEEVIDLLESPVLIETSRKDFWYAMVYMMQGNLKAYIPMGGQYLNIHGDDIIFKFLARKKLGKAAEDMAIHITD